MEEERKIVKLTLEHVDKGVSVYKPHGVFIAIHENCINKLEKDFDLQVRYLYFRINLNFFCTAKYGRIYFLCIFLESFWNSFGISADCLHC